MTDQLIGHMTPQPGVVCLHEHRKASSASAAEDFSAGAPSSLSTGKARYFNKVGEKVVRLVTVGQEVVVSGDSQKLTGFFL